ncbi:major strawberry allergen Fra a 1.05-like [Cornus florida]|uniref:major strawberry allergen Fra a 1.05-like n=1 Tax=Cornus florida TaxID=4283 RepID=UPI00289A3B47|nr:major strawberry allergen Fra a 1.05-like [Cornus florida]
MFKAFVLDSDNLIPKILPQAIKSVEIIQGDGGVGTIKVIFFGYGSQFKSIKHQVDGLDKDNFVYSYSIIEGDALIGVLEKISYEIKIKDSSDGGSVCKNSSKYHTNGDVGITEDQIKGARKGLGNVQVCGALPLGKS